LIAIALVPAFAVSHDRPALPDANGAQRREVYKAIEDFTLLDQRSRPFHFASLRGKVVVVAFTYTTCPDVCPLTTAAMRQIQESLTDKENRRSHFLTVTTDPEIDTPQVLAAYAKRYGIDLTNWGFLTGNQAALSGVWKNFGVGVQRKARGLVDHTTLTAIVDRNGIMRIVYINMPPAAKAVAGDLRTLLADS
jgi:protein SCO1/2